MMRSTLVIPVLLSLVLGGCAHRVMLDSDPPGASVKVDGKMVGVTPTEISVQWAPFRHNEVQLKLPHRRTVVLDLQKDVGLLRLSWEVITFRWGRLSGKVPRTVHRMHFVRKHGPAGTWVPEEAK